MKSSRRILFTAAALVALTQAPAQGATPVSPRNEQLLAALEPLEGLTEDALGGSVAKIEKSLKSADADRAKTRGLLTPELAARFDKLFSEVNSAHKKKDNIATALAAAELYKVVTEALDPTALTIPKEVSLLDYIGFRTKALLQAPTPDWNAIAQTAREANGYWATIRSRVTDKKLQFAMEKAQRDLAGAAEKKDAALCAAATREDLDLVDELESFFAK